jgi:hypothetical protein
MNLFRKHVLSFARVAAPVLLVSLATPPAAHASSASRIRGAIGAAVPVIGLPAPVSATKIITLSTAVEQGTFSGMHLLLRGGLAPAEYVVPAGQDLVITSVEISPQGGAPYAPANVYLQGTPGVSLEIWLVSNLVSTEFQYPTGFAFEAGMTPAVFAEMNCVVTLHGYLAPA